MRTVGGSKTLQRSCRVTAVVVPLGALFFQSLLAAGELGGACVFKPRPARVEAPAVVRSWEPRESEHERPEHQRKVQVQLVAEHKEPAHQEHAQPLPPRRAESHAPAPAPHAVAAEPLAPLPGPSPLLRNMLTNEGIVMMAQAGYTERFIVEMIHRKQTKFDVSPQGLAWLAQMGLTERIVRAMVANERKEDDTAMLPGFLSIPSEGEVPAPARSKSGRVKKTAESDQPARLAVPVTIQTPSDYWYSRAQAVLPER